MLTSFKLVGRPLQRGFNTTAARKRASWIPQQRTQLWEYPPTIAHNRRFKTSETGVDKSGHIEAGQNEGILFLDNVFPLKLSFLSGLPLINAERLLTSVMRRIQNPNVVAADPANVAERAIPNSLPIRILEILPRWAEGGAFVKFSHEPDQNVKEIAKIVKKHLEDKPIHPWFNPIRRVKTFLVHGRPWVEDLYRVPSAKVKVEFVPIAPGHQAEELSQETLYSLFRKYGKLVDIAAQPTDSKNLPKYAYLKFNTVRHAIRAKSCMHGFILPASEGGGESGTMLKLAYEQKRRAHYIWNWLVNHPRLVIPVLIAFFGTMSMAIFDPYISA